MRNPSEGAKKLLLVDDNKNFLYASSQLLMREGFEIMTAKSGYDGLRMVEQIEPDLILCDLMMPGMNGFEMKQLLNEHSAARQIPLIYVTARNSYEDRQQAKELGAAELIAKPFDYAELLVEISRAMEPTE